jgi:hypothetical protein
MVLIEHCTSFQRAWMLCLPDLIVTNVFIFLKCDEILFCAYQVDIILEFSVLYTFIDGLVQAWKFVVDVVASSADYRGAFAYLFCLIWQ